jgi:hypothetical protein
MDIYFSIIVRGAPVARGGEIVRLDWPTKKILARRPILPENPFVDDPNPRGNSRGGRGVAILPDGRVAVASYHSIYIFSSDLSSREQLTNGLFAGLHELRLTPRGTLWAASTTLDAALEVDYNTGTILRQFWPREMKPVQQEFGVTPLALDKGADNRARFLAEKHIRDPHHSHLNIVIEWGGEVYGLLHTFGAVVNLSQERVVFRDPGLKGAHNLILREDGVAIINNTYRHAVQFYEMKTGRLVREIMLTDFPEVKRLVRPLEKARYLLRGLGNRLGMKYISNPLPFFVRGLWLDKDDLYVGLSPSSILQLDVSSGKLTDWYSYSHNLASTVHGLCVSE